MAAGPGVTQHARLFNRSRPRRTSMAVVRYVLAKLKPGVDREVYERFEREVDYVVAGRLKSIVSYRTHRITEAGPRLQGGPWDYIERIEVTDRAAYEKEIAAAGKELIDELYAKYLDRAYTTSIWSELLEP
jgi:REDY-like protein HapK